MVQVTAFQRVGDNRNRSDNATCRSRHTQRSDDYAPRKAGGGVTAMFKRRVVFKADEIALKSLIHPSLRAAKWGRPSDR